MIISLLFFSNLYVNFNFIVVAFQDSDGTSSVCYPNVYFELY